MISYFYWDPSSEIFTIPIINWPIGWYGFFFATGFFIGYFIFLSLIYRYFALDPNFKSEDILDRDRLKKELGKKYSFKGKDQLKALNKLIHDPQFDSPQEGRLQVEKEIDSVNSLKEKARSFVDRFSFYIILGTVIGARIGHLIFYETPAYYISQPLRVFYVWEGGLASHGAVVGIICSVLLFYYFEKKRENPILIDWRRLLDYLTIPTALAGSFIRLGNFFNQEIVGIPSDQPWAVLFAHPFDGSSAVPRHPVQLYESLFYFLLFWVLWALSHRMSFFLSKGRLIGFFLTVVFTFRFFIEQFKVRLSDLDFEWFGSMGQILSIPVIILGIFFLIFSRRKAF